MVPFLDLLPVEQTALFVACLHLDHLVEVLVAVASAAAASFVLLETVLLVDLVAASFVVASFVLLALSFYLFIIIHIKYTKKNLLILTKNCLSKRNFLVTAC